MTSSLIFSTIHGYRLYGLQKADSDFDIFNVTTSNDRGMKHRVNSESPGVVVDTTEAGLDTFLRMANSGSHQSVEALFSTRKVWNMREYEPMLSGAFVCGPEVFGKYERTIRAFSYGDFKRRRHAVRLSMNLRDLRDIGRFDPEMDSMQVSLANGAAHQLEGDALVEKLLG